MKSMVKLHKIILVLFLLSPILSYAQKEKIGVDKDFTFDENSKTETFTFEVNKGTKEMKINFEGTISKGGLKVKIKDPNGNQVSGFSLKSSKSLKISYNYDYNSGSDKSEKAMKSENADKSENAKSSSNSRSSASARSSSRASSSSSSVSVEVKDSGKVETQNTHIYTKEKTETNETGARGIINKEITNPTEGIWEFTIYPDNTSGNLLAKITYK